MTIQELQVIISANTDQFKNELTSIGGKLDDFSKKAEKTGENTKNGLFGNLVGANVVGDIITKSIGNVIDSFKSLTNEVYSNGSAYSILKITTNTVAHNMNISASAIQGLRGQFNSLNINAMQSEEIIKTLALSGLTNLSSKIQTVDASTGQLVHGTNALIVAMNDLSTSAGITAGEGMDRITKFIRLGRVQAIDGMVDIGKLTIAENNFAFSLHKTTEQLTQQQLEQFRVNVIMQESQKVIGDYANTSQTSARATELLGTALSNMATTLGSFLEPIFSVVQNALLTFVNALGVELNGSAISIQDWATSVAGYIMGLVRIIGSLLSWLPIVGAGFQALANFSLKPVRNIDATANSVKNLTNQTNALNHAMAGLASFDQMNVLTPQAGTGATPTSPTMGGMGGLGSGLDVSKINDTASGLVKTFDDLKNSVKEFLKPLTDIKIFGIPLIDIFKDFIIVIGLVGAGMIIIPPIIGLITGGFTLLTSVIGAIAGSFSIAGLVIIGIIAIFKNLYDTNIQFRTVIDTIANTIKNVLISAWNELGTIISDIWNNVVKPVINWFSENIVPIFIKIGMAIADMVNFAAQRIPVFIQNLQPLIHSVGNLLHSAFKLLGDIISWLWKEILKPLVDFFTSNVIPAFRFLVDLIIANVVPAFKSIVDYIVTQIVPAFVSFVTPIINNIIPALTQLWESFKITFSQIKELIKEVWNNVLQPIFRAIGQFIIEQVIPRLQDFWNKSQVVFNAIGQIVSRVWGGIREVIEGVVNFILDIPNKLNGLRNGISNLFNGIKDVITNIWNGITNTIKDAINHLLHLINDGLGGINSFANKLSDTLAQIPGSQRINLQIGTIPYLASGGIVDAPTVAMIGEGGYKEAVLPLDRNTGWAEKVATLINGAMGNTGEGGQTLVVQLGSEKIYEKFISYLNDKSLATNTAVINI